MSGAADRALLVLDRVGEGRVAQLLSDHLWLWSRGYEGGGPQAELLRRTAHWLMREPDLEEDVLHAFENGRALGRERVGQDVYIAVGGGSLQKKTTTDEHSTRTQ